MLNAEANIDVFLSNSSNALVQNQVPVLEVTGTWTSITDIQNAAQIPILVPRRSIVVTGTGTGSSWYQPGTRYSSTAIYF